MSTLSTRKIKHDSSAVDNITLNSDGTTTANRSLIIDTATNGVPSISLKHANTDADNFIIQAGTPGVTNSGLTIRDIDAAANRLIIDSAGRVTTPAQPAFDAFRTGNVTSTTDTFVQVAYNNTALNVGNCFNTSNGAFTAPTAGLYQFNINYFGNKPSSTGRIDLAIYINGSNVRGVEYQGMRTDVAVNTGFQFCQAIYLNTNDSVTVYTRCFTNAGLIYGDGYFNRFSGYLVG